MLNVYKVWSGRYSKLVIAKTSDQARRSSGYKDVDQVDLVIRGTSRGRRK